MNTDDFTDTLDVFLRDRLRLARTIIPCRVVKVDYTLDRVDCKPLTKTRYKNGTQLTGTDMISVPLMTYSANAANARITVPTTIGDTVLVLCSDREFGDLLETTGKVSDSEDIQPLGLYPIMALPCFLPSPAAKTLDKENIEIHNGSTSIKVSPDGAISLSTDTSVNIQCNTAVVDATSSVSVTAPTTTFDGSISVTGTITSDGTITSTLGDVVAGTVSLKNHKHTGGTISGNTGTPIP